jgi:hypothetical protein
MITLNVVQGTTEWAMARLGIPTASNFDKIITPAKLQFSRSSVPYAHQLIAEQLLGVPLDNATSGFMQRGQTMERRALAYYSMQRDVDEMKPIGFVLRDDRRAGCSPDHFVDADGLLEIKVPSAAVHVGYLLDDQGIGYKCQVQGQLWISEREWCDTLSWNPELPAALVRQYRDEKFIAALSDAVDQFLSMMDDMKVHLAARGDFPDLTVPDLRVVA